MQSQAFPSAMSLRTMPSPLPPPSPSYYPTFAPQLPVPPKSSQRLLGGLLKPLLVPTILVGLPLWPFLALTCAVPIIGVMAVPLLLLLSLILLYSIAWLSYLLLAQPDLPAAWLTRRRWSPRNIAPFLPLSPFRCAKVDLAAIRYAKTVVRIAFPAVFDWSYRRVMVLGTQKGARVVKEGILYGSPVAGKRLDVYLPSSPVDEDARETKRGRKHSTAFPEPTGSASAGPSSIPAQSRGAPVVIVVPSVMAPLSWTSKRKLYLQLALRLRRMGYCVIVPDITYFPESRIKSSIIDLRLVMRWAAKNCQRYGGDPLKIHLMGHGLSAHLIMLTIAQEAVVLSREGHLDRAYQRQKGLEKWSDEDTKSGEVGEAEREQDTLDEGYGGPVHIAERGSTDAWVDDDGSNALPPGGVMGGTRKFDRILNSNAYRQAEEEVGNGLKRVEIYEPQIDIPPLAGVILLSGISDVIKGFRSESEKGLEHLSFLRRSTGPSHIQCLLHSPAHLLYAAKNILDTRLLPPKFLLVHGGRDTVVPVEQSTLLKTLLVGIGVESVRLRAYRNLGHAESMACLFLGMGKANTRYTRQILDDIAAFVSQ